jgi:hypothetical protein
MFVKELGIIFFDDIFCVQDLREVEGDPDVDIG